jgi:hypothetical protein
MRIATQSPYSPDKDAGDLALQTEKSGYKKKKGMTRNTASKRR